jgi:hypothetical protein
MLISGIINVTLSKISKEWFYKISKTLLNGNFKYPVKCFIYISKCSKDEMYSIIIANLRVKIIEKIIRNVFEPMFEKGWT